jgi:predicted TIM-barrel fold metal-dependent hydrolase
MGSFAGGTQAGVRFDAPRSLRYASRFEDVRPGAYDPAAHLAENLDDGVVGSVLYPTAGLNFYMVPDPGLFAAICRAYNDWLADFCSYDTARLKGMAMISLDDRHAGIEEMARCRDAGLAGAMISVFPGRDEDSYTDASYDDVWTAAEELALPLVLHVGTNRVGLFSATGLRSLPASTLATQDYWVRTALGDMVFSGVFERHPSLRVGSVEFELAWAPFFVELLDYTYTQRPDRPGWHRYADPDARPSDFFRRNVFLSFQEDRRGLADRELLGVSNLLWGSDYPHVESTFPRSAAILDELFDAAECSAEERRLISFDNTAALFGFGIDAGHEEPAPR